MIELGSVPSPGTLGRALARPSCYYQALGTLGLTVCQDPSMLMEMHILPLNVQENNHPPLTHLKE